MSRESNSLVRICAFIALIILGIFAALSLISWFGGVTGWYSFSGGKIFNVLGIVKDIALVIVLVLAAWDYTKDKGRSTVTFFWVAVILILCMYFVPQIYNALK